MRPSGKLTCSRTVSNSVSPISHLVAPSHGSNIILGLGLGKGCLAVLILDAVLVFIGLRGELLLLLDLLLQGIDWSGFIGSFRSVLLGLARPVGDWSGAVPGGLQLDWHGGRGGQE